MIQDIAPYKLKNEYRPVPCKDSDHVVVFDDEDRILAKCDGEEPEFLHPQDVCSETTVYLFSVGGLGYYMADKCENIPDGYSFRTIRELRDNTGGYQLFAAFTAYHLHRWYSRNRYCGRCGSPTVHDDKERALRCTKCGNIEYPRINPAVIVAVTSGDKIVTIRYRAGYGGMALIAGFTEIGETLEETVAREVMEEVGLKVKNIRYYKSQPWGIAADILAGFFCEVDGDDTIRIDENELKQAAWTTREEIEPQKLDYSLTGEMMQLFKDGKIE